MKVQSAERSRSLLLLAPMSTTETSIADIGAVLAIEAETDAIVKLGRIGMLVHVPTRIRVADKNGLQLFGGAALATKISITLIPMLDS